MAERTFPIEQFYLSGRSQKGPVATCRKCGVKEYFPRSGGMITAQKFFQNKGWELGRSHHMDVCPSCLKPVRKHNPKPKVESSDEDDMAYKRFVPNMSVSGASDNSKADAPRVMTRDERLITMDKIRDVHDGDSYSSGWSDRRVSEDLGIPRAWVEDIRENVLMFKGAGDGAWEKLLFEEIVPFRNQLDDMSKRLIEQQGQVDAFRAKLVELERRGEKAVSR